MAGNAPLLVEDVVELLRKRYGKPSGFGRSRLFKFGNALTCSINYSKMLRGEKYFFGLAKEVVDRKYVYPETELGALVLLICGSANKVLVLPRSIVLDMTRDLPTRKLDVFCEDGIYILQTTRHPKLNVTQFLNAFPHHKAVTAAAEEVTAEKSSDRVHIKIQGGLIQLGRVEGCTVWVPPNDRNLSSHGKAFASLTLERLPNFGFDENTRRIVHNIDVLWLTRNVIRKAFEIESTTSIYSGLLRLNDLVLAQPNNQIDLFIVANKTRREKVFNQLIRPSFQELARQCQFVSFKVVEDAVNRVESLKLGKDARVSGLFEGERFSIPDHYIYPTGV
jgi:hypothetical protein